MTCGLWREKLEAYVDGNCAQGELSTLEEHLQGCPQCAAEALRLSQMKQATRAASAARYTPSPQFRLRLEESLAGGAKKSRKLRFAFAWTPALSAVALTLLLVAVSVLWMRHSDREQTVAELLDLHVATLASANPVDVVSTDRHTVKPWFQGKLPFAFNIPELGGTPFKLLGGKLVYFRQSPGAQLLFELGKHQLSVFILQDKVGIAAGASHEKGFSVEDWSQGGLRYVAISDASPSDVRALSDLLRAAGNQ